MKKIAYIFVALFITSITNGQTVRIGLKAGINYANFTGSELKTDAITSYHAGLLAEISLLDSFSIQPELIYSTQGASYKDAITEYKNELGYIAIPIMLKFYLTKSLSLELGPQASFLLSKKDDVVIKDYNTYDFSANGGLGLKLTKSIFVQARYNLGLTEVSKNADIKNSVFQLSVGLLF